ncbi:outer membrane protein assembly factor BamE domain-containing protein [Alloalcanivorax xenomutans]|uniref:outer membrane protein assembly factor BamE domain-containing protein n=1 Tax=Alloalcanivorax xenomutans TaxID=1094342 RepID=UPI003009C875
MIKGLNIRLLATALFSVLLLGGCATATSGAQFNADAVQQLQPGVTTTDDARAILGEPQQIVTLQDGNQLYVWQYVESKARGTSVNTAIQQASVLFSGTGKMIRVQQVINTPGTLK